MRKRKNIYMRMKGIKFGVMLVAITLLWCMLNYCSFAADVQTEDNMSEEIVSDENNDVHLESDVEKDTNVETENVFTEEEELAEETESVTTPEKEIHLHIRLLTDLQKNLME